MKMNIRTAIAAVLLAGCAGAWAQADKLVAVLGSDADQKAKADACRELAHLGDKTAVPALAKLLPDEKLSHMARYALEAMPGEEAGAALRGAMGTLSGNLLIGVIHSVGMRRDPAAVDALAARLGDADAGVAAAAAGALGRIGNAKAADALTKALAGAPADRRPALCDGLLQAGDAALAAGRKGDAEKLFDLVQKADAPPHLRAAGLYGVLRARGDGAGPLVAEQLRSDDLLRVAMGLRALHEVPGSRITRAAGDVLGALPPERQAQVLTALGARGDKTALPALTATAQAGPDATRAAAIGALVSLGDPDALPALIAVATAAGGGAAAAAAQAALASFSGPKADDAIVKLLEAPTPEARALALQLVGQRRIDRARPALVKMAEGGDAAARAAALKALGEMGGAGEIAVLTRLVVKPPAPEAARAAEAALLAVCTRVGDAPAAAAALVPAFEQASPETRKVLLRALCAVGGPQALAAVRKAAGGGDAELQAAARRALCDWRDAGALPDVAGLARSAEDPTLKILALRGYIRLAGRMEAPAVKKVAALKDAMEISGRDDERRLVLGALGGVPDAGALALVAPYLENPALKEEAAQAAVAIAAEIVEKNPAAVAEVMAAAAKAAGDEKLQQKARQLANKARKAPAP